VLVGLACIAAGVVLTAMAVRSTLPWWLSAWWIPPGRARDQADVGLGVSGGVLWVIVGLTIVLKVIGLMK
jgi:hypothetical protein